MSTAAFCCVATNADHARTSESTRIDITTSQKYGREKHTRQPNYRRVKSFVQPEKITTTTTKTLGNFY